MYEVPVLPLNVTVEEAAQGIRVEPAHRGWGVEAQGDWSRAACVTLKGMTQRFRLEAVLWLWRGILHAMQVHLWAWI